MGGRNGYTEKLNAAMKAGFEAGLACGRQQMTDMMSLVLRDPNIMGKDIFGKDRLLKVVHGIKDYIDIYQKAWERDDETDYYRAKMDANLAEAYGEGMHDTFLERYKYAPEFNYNTGKWSK